MLTAFTYSCMLDVNIVDINTRKGQEAMSESGIHVVAGLGPVGRAVVDELVGRGLPVRAIARRPASKLPIEVEVVRTDISDIDDARRAMTGASVVYHTASAPYDRWPKLLPPLMRGVVAGATASGAKIVYADNLYAYGPVDGPLTEDLPLLAAGPNGRVRATLATELMAAHASGRVRATIGRASDYFGPRGRQSTAGERLFEPAIAGQAAQVLGNPDMPHTFTYVPDFARALVTLGTRDTAFGEIWHVPSAETISTREFAALVFAAAGQPLNLKVLPPALLAVASLVNPMLRAVREQQYQRTAPWVVDHSRFATAFGAEVTPHREAIAATVAWFAAADRSSADN
jgi:nucleoside-diphosphate-sugar epimerase